SGESLPMTRNSAPYFVRKSRSIARRTSGSSSTLSKIGFAMAHYLEFDAPTVLDDLAISTRGLANSTLKRAWSSNFIAASAASSFALLRTRPTSATLHIVSCLAKLSQQRDTGV